MGQLYRENYSWKDIKHHYEKCMILDQTTLAQVRVPFWKSIAVDSFYSLMLEEIDVSKCVLDDNDCNKHSFVF